MKTLGVMILSLMFISLSAFSDDWTYRHQVKKAAHDLSQKTSHFASSLEHNRRLSHLSGDVSDLAQKVEHFHHAIERGTDYSHALNDFQNIEHDFTHVRGQLHRRHTYLSEHLWNEWYQAVYTFGYLIRLMESGAAQ